MYLLNAEILNLPLLGFIICLGLTIYLAKNVLIFTVVDWVLKKFNLFVPRTIANTLVIAYTSFDLYSAMTKQGMIDELIKWGAIA